MTEAPDSSDRWYTRPVFFVSDIDRAIRFYVDMLGFTKSWHEGDGAGTVCQVNHGECEIILCEDPARRDQSRLFISLTPEAFDHLCAHLQARSVETKETWWGYDTLQVNEPTPGAV